MAFVGTIVEATDLELTLTVDTLVSWPSHLKQKKLNRSLTLTVPDPTGVAEATPGQRIVVWTLPAPGTVEALTGAPTAISLDRLTPA